MARIRSIRPEIWDSQKVGTLSVLARLTFIGIISIADDEGRGRGDHRFLMSRIHPYATDIDAKDFARTLSELEKKSLAVFYTVDESQYYVLPGWCVHQKIDKPNASLLPAPPDGSDSIRRALHERSQRTRPGMGVDGKGMDGKTDAPAASDSLGFWNHKLRCGTEFKDAVVNTLTVETAERALKEARPNAIDKRALEWWIAEKKRQRSGMSKDKNFTSAADILASGKVGK